MTSSTQPPTLRIAGPADLLQAVPYLLGFHPRDSLVLVGLYDERLVVTARVNLCDLTEVGVLSNTLRAISRGGVNEVVAAVYDDSADRVEGLPWHEVVDDLRVECIQLRANLNDALLVSGDRWWSYLRAGDAGSTAGGTPLPAAPSVFVAAATVAGVVALPDRESLAAVLDPHRDDVHARLATRLDAEQALVRVLGLDERRMRFERSVKRAMFADARLADYDVRAGRAIALGDGTAARFGVALTSTALRDAVWMGVDDRRIDGRALWRELARRLPSPYDAAPLFLYGWASWRDGNGALANIAAERAITSDPGYRAADLLLAMLGLGVDPRRMPRLRLPRS